MTDKEQKKAAKDFAARWEGKGYEKGQSQQFWLDLLVNVYGVKDIAGFISFEDQVMLDHTSFIDGYINSTHVMIEQKSLDKDLRKGIKQSDGSVLSPFQQAKRYAAELPYSKRPRWIITCNFAEFLVYDMEKPNGEPEQIFLKDLAKEYYRLAFIVDTANENIKKEMEISLKAGELVGKLYDAILKQYADPDSEETLKSLNKLCVRLVFCLYAEDADIFGKHQMFHDYMKRFSARDFRKALIELFQILDTKPEDRDKYLDDDLAAFPYVNGGLFADEHIEIPRFTDEIIDILLRNASEDFDWSGISPTIFGAVFESTLNPETRRSGGMHYTSIENIHKVIDPLFLDELRKELENIKATYKVDKTKKAKIEEFRDKLASLTFLDPACGSGNFLTETYISLRRLENEALKYILDGQMMFDIDPIKVNISQFYGIEINDFAVTVAKTALWIAEAQMLQETEEIVEHNIPFLPLKSYANITEGNALRTDWESVVPKDKLSYIMGNPPFVGYSLQSKAQKEDMLSIYVDEKGKPYKTAGKIDYVAAWYFKAAQLMENTVIRTAFVSTNSITQGEQVAGVWKPLYDRFGIHIDFAHRTFRWDSEASLKAHVHCVIVGFSIAENKADRRLYDNGADKIVKNINPFLVEAPNVFIESRSTPICNVPKMTTGNRPADGGHLIIEKEDYADFIKREPSSIKYIKKLVGSTEFINNKDRYCLWLVGVSPAELRKMPEVMKRVELCRQDRLNSPDKGRQKLAETPTLFRETNNPESYIIVPAVSSEKRRYVPMGFLSAETISTNLNIIIPNATLYHLGVLTSNVHMAWMRTVCGRLKSDYRYSKDIVYNNYPWCTPTDEQKARIEQTAQMILDARVQYPDCSLADLYDETTMPPELRKAHQANDLAVMAAYGFDKKITESECVAELMKMYQKLTENK
ncbi:DNA methyltransferase [Ruminococcus flavefaciens]|uniref:DNA methyltransferase n=1 Tax=Ruminococcus flavefaciens TaxID=1265 RepID=UPI0026EDB125|nr:DNA methyltransferase [Ruminococcus flavefaciens]